MIVTIDGYAGSGKSTAAVRLADALGFRLLNTGAMYRAAAVALGRADIDIYAEPRDADRIARLVAGYSFELPGDRVLLNGEDLTAAVRTEEAGRGASRVGLFPEVRARLKQEQRRLAGDRDVICEGRDQGTAVFPDAPVKFFFRASADVRADRRVAQLAALGLPADRAAIRASIVLRDRQDETRPIDPLARAADAVEIDTSAITEDEVLRLMLDVVGRCRSTG
jgi:cytidylate kinase